MHAMKKRSFVFLVALIGISLVFSCSKEEENAACPATPKDTLTLRFTAFTNGDTMEYRKEFRDPMNRLWRVEKFIHYVSDIYLIEGNTETLVEDVALLTYERNGDIDVTDELKLIKIPVERGNYDGIRLSIGLNPVQNASNPGDFPPEHPLSGDQNMWWGQWAQYRFGVFDGKIDSDGSGSIGPEDVVTSHHPGLDTSYQTKTFNKNFEVSSSGNNMLDFTVEFNEIYYGNDTIDPVVHSSWHGTPEDAYISVILMSNMANSMELK